MALVEKRFNKVEHIYRIRGHAYIYRIRGHAFLLWKWDFKHVKYCCLTFKAKWRKNWNDWPFERKKN